MAFWNLPEFFGNTTGLPDFEEDPRNVLPPVRCPTGYRINLNYESGCVACPGGCSKCTSDTSCRSCMSRKFIFDRRRRTCECYTGPYNSATNDCDECGTNQFWDGDECKSCGVDFCSRCKRENYCTRCETNFTKR